MKLDFDFTKKNVGTNDGIIRAILGVLLIIGAARSHSWLGGLIGAVLLATAYLRFCPAYSAFGLCTIKDDGPAKDITPAAK